MENLRKKIIAIVAGIIILNFFGVFSHVVHTKGTLASTAQDTKNTVWNTIVGKLSTIHNTYAVSDPGNNQINFVAAANASENNSYDSASAYISLDFDSGNVILEKNPDQAVPIASLTKIMSAVVALDLASPQESITISQDAANQIPTKIGVIPGQQMSVYELLEGMLLTSANDAAGAIKDGIDAKYGSPVFIDAMNKKAELLGLTHTHFMNPAGLDDPAHYSSARDLAVLSHYALTNYPVIAEIVKKDYQFLPATATHRQFDLVNWNGLLDVYPNVFGVKIGNTEAAGTTIIAGSERNGKRVLAVLLGAPDILKRDTWTIDLLNDSFNKQYGLDPVAITQDDLQAKYNSWNQYL